MSVSNTTTKVSYSGNDSTTSFAITFDFRNNTEIEVILRDENVSPATETLQVIVTDYTIAGGNPGTSVEMITAPATGEKLIIRRVTTKTQATDYIETADFPADSHEEALDKLTLTAQEICEALDRAPKMPKTSTVTPNIPEPQAGRFLRWNDTGTDLETAVDVVVAELATQAEAEGGTENENYMSPLRTKQQIDFRLATQAEAEAGTNNVKLMTPLRVDQALTDEKGAVNGIASLDGTGRIPSAQLPVTATEFKGAFDASVGGSGSPSLTDGTGTNGDMYRVSVAGTVDHGAGSVTYGVGDAVIYNGTVWQKIPADDAVSSVNGQTGIVSLDTDDIAEGGTNLYFTNARADARVAAADVGDLANVDETGKLVGQTLEWDGANWVPAAAGIQAPNEPDTLTNLGLQTSVAASALTIDLKQADGATDPTGPAPVTVSFRSATAATGSFTKIDADSARTITVPSGATLGHRDATDEFIYVYALSNLGTLELAVSSRLYDEGSIISTSAIGAASDDDDIYSTVARSNVPIRLLGRLKSNQTTAGTWAANMTEISLASENLINEQGLVTQQVFDTAGAFTWNKPPGVKRILVELIGGGGAGGGAAATGGTETSSGSGGGAGGYSKELIELTAATMSVSVTVGAGGTGALGAAGGNGGSTSFGAFLSATGGTGGGITPASSTPNHNKGAAGGSGTGGDINIGGGDGESSFADGSTSYGGNGGDGFFGGAGAGAGWRAASADNGVAGKAPGAGAGGNSNYISRPASTGPNGADGIVIVWEYR